MRAVGISLLILATLRVVAASTTVTISGMVVDESGAALSGATVYYHSSPTILGRTPGGGVRESRIAVATSMVTGKDGTFSIGNLPQSTYYICAAGTRQTHLRSCDWGLSTTKLDLTSSTGASGIKLQISDGVLLTFTVHDNAGKVIDFTDRPVVNGKLVPHGNFRIFVYDAGRLMAASLVSAQGNLRTYQLAVPKVRNLQLLLGTSLKVAGQGGTLVTAGAPADTIAINGQAADIQLTVQ